MEGNGKAAAASKHARRTGEDRLSALPDDVLLQILVLLPLIEAMRTCVLSRRWSALWTHLQRLDFFDTQVGGGGYGRFAGLVDGALSRVAGLGRGVVRCLRVRIFREANVDVGRITSWARFAAERITDEFHLWVVILREDEQDQQGDEPVFELPCFVKARFISLSLRHRIQLALPTAGVFASLTKLMMFCVRFSAGAGAVLGDVVSTRCPFLETLEMVQVAGVMELRLHSASLVHLCLSFVTELKQLGVVAQKLQTMGVESCFIVSEGAVVSISAPKLQLVHWQDCCPEQTHIGRIEHLQKLVVGELPVKFLTGLGGVHSNFDVILKHFRRTDVLELHIPIHPELVGHGQLMEHIVLPHYSELGLFVAPNKHMFGASMLPLLKRCIGLSTLHVSLCQRKGDTACLYSCIWDHPPSWRYQNICLNSLKKLVVKDFSDTIHEADFLSFIFGCVESLQNITIVLREGVQPTTAMFHMMGLLRFIAYSVECYYICNQKMVRFM